MRLNITWRDRRVDFLNLREDIYQNLVPDYESSQMWIPEIGKYSSTKVVNFVILSHISHYGRFL